MSGASKMAMSSCAIAVMAASCTAPPTDPRRTSGDSLTHGVHLQLRRPGPPGPPVRGLAPLQGVRQRRAVGAAHRRRVGGAGRGLRDVAGDARPGLAGGPAGVPGHRGRRPRAAHHGQQHRGDRHRAGSRPDRRGAPALVDPVLAAAAAQLPPGPLDPGGAQRVHRHVRLQRGRPVHRRPRGRCTDRGLPAAGHQRVDPAAVRQPRLRRVLRRPSRALDPDRRHQPPDRAQHPPHHRPGGVGAGRGGPAAGARVGGAVGRPELGLHPDRPPGAVAAAGRRDRRHHRPAPPGRPARHRGHRDRLGVDARRRTIRRPAPRCSRSRSSRTSVSASSGPSSRTSGSGSASRPTSPARRCPRRSTTPTRRCRPSSTSPSSTATSPSDRSAPRSSTDPAAGVESSCPAARSRTTSGSSATSSAGTARTTSA